MNMESLSKSELLMLFSILEGELEARDLVIDALKVPRTLQINIFCSGTLLFAFCQARSIELNSTTQNHHLPEVCFSVCYALKSGHDGGSDTSFDSEIWLKTSNIDPTLSLCDRCW